MIFSDSNKRPDVVTGGMKSAATCMSSTAIRRSPARRTPLGRRTAPPWRVRLPGEEVNRVRNVLVHAAR